MTLLLTINSRAIPFICPFDDTCKNTLNTWHVDTLSSAYAPKLDALKLVLVVKASFVLMSNKSKHLADISNDADIPWRQSDADPHVVPIKQLHQSTKVCWKAMITTPCSWQRYCFQRSDYLISDKGRVCCISREKEHASIVSPTRKESKSFVVIKRTSCQHHPKEDSLYPEEELSCSRSLCWLFAPECCNCAWNRHLPQQWEKERKCQEKRSNWEKKGKRN